MKDYKFNRVSCGMRHTVLAAVGLIVSVSLATADAQTIIYDGSQPLNYFGASHLTDDLALTNDPAGGTPASPRNGVVHAGADPNVLEVGDAAWFRSTGRRMRNTDSADMIGLASSATGVDGFFMTANTGTADNQMDSRAVGAGYVLYDAGTTTGMQTLNFSLFYNDATPNAPDAATLRNSGGNVAVRVLGVNNSNDASDPWATDDFTFLAASGGSAATISSGRYNDKVAATDPLDPTQPVVDQLLFLDSARTNGPSLLNPVANEWQSLSFAFDAGTGYDFLLFNFAGAEQDGTNLTADRFGFDNISFEDAPDMGLACDLDADGQCDLVDIEMLIDDVVAGNATAADIDTWLSGASDPANPYLGGTKTFLLGDADLNGNVDSSDLGLLLNNFGDTNGADWMAGNMNGDANVDSSDLGLLLNNFGAMSAASVAAVPEPSSLGLLFLAAFGVFARSGKRSRRRSR